jgi:hypothetical protein
MKVRELLSSGIYYVDLNTLQPKNLLGLCKLGLHVSLVRMCDGDIPYCQVSSPCVCLDKFPHQICIFPVRDSMEICTVVNRVISVIDFMGYIKHVKK